MNLRRILIICARCQQSAETQPNPNEFTYTYPIRDKDGQIYCWDCYKDVSRCKGCQKSVANLKFPRSGNSPFPHVGGYSIGCERIENEVEFICSEECSEKLADQKYQAWKDKLSQGWTKCERCVKFWIYDHSEKEGWKWLKEERQHSRFIKLLPPGQEKKICDNCKPYAKNGYYHKIHQKAQKYWDSLNKEERLKEIERTDGVGMAKWYGKDLTAEQLAEQEKVPRSLYEDFVHNQKCGSCGEEPCRKNKRNKNNNSLNANNFSASSAKQNNETAGKQKNTQTGKTEKSFQDEPTNSKSPNNGSVFLVVGGLLVIGAALIIGYLLGKDYKSKK